MCIRDFDLSHDLSPEYYEATSKDRRTAFSVPDESGLWVEVRRKFGVVCMKNLRFESTMVPPEPTRVEETSDEVHLD